MSLVVGYASAILFSANLRAVLAVAAIAVSVSYALVSGAAVGGLKEAQATLSAQVLDTQTVVVRPGREPFVMDELGATPQHALAVHAVAGRVFYTDRAPAATNPDPQAARITPASGLPGVETAELAGRALRLERGAPPPGALAAWIGLHPDVFDAVGGPAAPLVHVAVFDALEAAPERELRNRGFDVVEAPATLAFYVRGADQLVSVLYTTVLASGVVVGLLASALIHFELRARRATLATLQLYGGPARAARFAAGRGLFLLLAGHATGYALTAGLLLAVRTSGIAPLRIEPSFATVATAATLVGGLLGLVPAVRRSMRSLRIGHLRPAAAPLRRPVILRPILTSWRVGIPLAVAAAILAASLGVAFGVVSMPNQVFGSGDAEVIASHGGNPLRGVVAASLADHLAQKGVAHSPEIFVPTTLREHPVMVRGVDWERMQAFEPVPLVAGRPPLSDGEASLGARLASRLAARIGDRLTAPAPYDASALSLQVVGLHASEGIVGDEALVSLETARLLAGLKPDDVTLIRHRELPRDPRTPAPPVGPNDPVPEGIQVLGLRVVPDRPVPFEDATAVVQLRNFDPVTQTRQFTLRVEGQPVLDRWVAVPGGSGLDVELPFRVPEAGVARIDVNPSLDLAIRPAPYRVEAPAFASTGSNLSVQVLYANETPAAGVEVVFAGARNETDAEGRAQVPAGPTGNRTLVAQGLAGRAARTVAVLDSAHLDGPWMVWRELRGPSRQPGGDWAGVGMVENVGGRPFNGSLRIPVDDRVVDVAIPPVAPGEIVRVPLAIELDEGDHRIGLPEASVAVRISRADPQLVRELLDYRRNAEARGASPRADATEAFLGDTYENLDAALTIVVMATLLHAGLITVAVVNRELEERAPIVGSLAASGAARGALRRRVVLEYGEVGILAAVVGTIVGLALAGYGARQGILMGFGHALLPRADVDFAVRAAAAALATTLGAALLALDRVREHTARRLFVSGPVRRRRPPLARLLEGPG